MNSIIVKHIIDVNNININFDFSDGSLSFPSIELNIEDDIDLNSLVLKLTELIEDKRSLEVKFEDNHSLIENNPKIQLIKDTLEEIYTLFNEHLKGDTEDTLEIDDDDDDLPF